MNRTGQYLLAIYVLACRNAPPVHTKAVADALGRSQAAVSEKFQRLDDSGLVVYEPYEGVTLTEPGRKRAVTMHRVYAIILWFYRTVLAFDARENEALTVAEVLSPSAARRLTEVTPSRIYAGTPVEEVPLAVPNEDVPEQQ